MTDESLILLMFATFLIIALTGVPIAFALIGSAFVALLFTDLSYAGLISQLYNGVNNLSLLAIPFYILIAEVMNTADVSARIIDFVRTLVGHVRAGLAQVNAVFSMFFAGISGSSTADVAAVSKILLPEMKKEGYEPANSAALIATASTIAHLIPPSITAIAYGAIGGVSVTALFLSGVVPGVFVGVMLMIYSYFFVTGGVRQPRAKVATIARTGKNSIFALLIPVIIMGGILGGFFTPTEAGVVALVYVIAIVIPLYNRGRLRFVGRDFITTSKAFTPPLYAVTGGFAFAWVFTFLGGPTVIAELLQPVFGNSGTALMFCMVIMLVLAGQFIDALAAIVIFMPIILEFVRIGDIQPVHMGTVCLVTLAFGMISPPFGLALLMASDFAGVTFGRAVRQAVPLYGLYLVIVVILVLVPEISLWLPRVFVPQSAGCFPAPDGGGFICP